MRLHVAASDTPFADGERVKTLCGKTAKANRVTFVSKLLACPGCQSAMIERANAIADRYDLMAERLQSILELATPPAPMRDA